MKSYWWGTPDEKLIKNGKVMCPKCMKHLARIDNQYGVQPCKSCTEKALQTPTYKGVPINYTENSERIKKQREKYHDDFLQPHTYNKSSKKLEINREFVDKYPDKAHLYYSPEEMKSAGYPKLAEYSKTVQHTEAIQKQRIEAFKSKVMEARQSGNPNAVRELISRLSR